MTKHHFTVFSTSSKLKEALTGSIFFRPSNHASGKCLSLQSLSDLESTNLGQSETCSLHWILHELCSYAFARQSRGDRFDPLRFDKQ